MAKRDPFLAQVGELVRKARLAAGLSQLDLANESGVPQQAISRIEGGTRNATLKTLHRLATTMGVATRSLLPTESES